MAKKKDDLALTKVMLDRHWNSAIAPRKEIDWKWFVYDLWVSGNHYAKWDRNTQQIVTSQRDKGKPKIIINKIYTTLRGVRNFTLRNRPKAEVTPESLTEENIEEARKLNLFLDYLHDRLSLRRKLKAIVWHALKYSVGFWQVLWDEDKGENGEIAVNIVDPYDLYYDPAAKDPDEAKYVILAVRRNLQDLKDDKKYDVPENLKGDTKLAASSLKERLLNAEKGGGIYNEKEEKEGTVIVREHWYKEDDKIMIAAIANDQIIRKPEDTGLTRFPFFRLQADVEPLEMYGTGWVKNLIPVNRALNRLESQIAEYNDIMNKGKWIADKGAGVRIINNENGQIIEKKRGFDVGQAPIASLSVAVFQQIENMNRYIEDIGGAHDASLGRIPPGAKSGRALEALQVGDSNNMSEIVENVEEFLEDVYEYILSLVAEKYQFARRVVPLTRSGEREFIKVIGETAQNKPEEAVVINKNNSVDVKITSWLAHTAEARRETLKELYQLQAIDQETLLEGYNIGSVSEIIKKTKEQQLNQAAQNIEVSRQQAQATASQPEQEAQQGSQAAIAAIRQIINGAQPQPPSAPSPEFISYLDSFLVSEEAKGLDRAVLTSIQNFRDQVVQGVR